MTSETFIPNSFQVPNVYVDRFMAYLTPEEWMVLSYAARRIFGFQRRQDRISLSQFQNGITTREGIVLDRGTGLSRHTVQRAIGGLLSAGLLIRLEAASMDQTPALFALQLSPDQVNIEFLENRLKAKEGKNNAKATKARAKKELGHAVPQLELGQEMPQNWGTGCPRQGHEMPQYYGTAQPLQKTEKYSEIQENNNSVSSLFSPPSCYQVGLPTDEQRAFFEGLISKVGVEKVEDFLRFHQGKTWGHVVNIFKKHPRQLENWEVKPKNLREAFLEALNRDMGETAPNEIEPNDDTPQEVYECDSSLDPIEAAVERRRRIVEESVN